jgi:S1-C subfamily serine protease
VSLLRNRFLAPGVFMSSTDKCASAIVTYDADIPATVLHRVVNSIALLSYPLSSHPRDTHRKFASGVVIERGDKKYVITVNHIAANHKASLWIQEGQSIVKLKWLDSIQPQNLDRDGISLLEPTTQLVTTGLNAELIQGCTVGQMVYAFGFPFSNTTTTLGGSPSPASPLHLAYGRTTEVSSEKITLLCECGDIVNGMSGGGLFDADGNLIGLNAGRLLGSRESYAYSVIGHLAQLWQQIEARV